MLAHIGVGDDQRVLDHERVRAENSRSRPRSSVTLATTATRIAGTAAITENRPTIWTCSRAAALPRRRACTICQTSRPMMPSSNRTASALTPSRRDDDVVGRVIGVRPARTRKVAQRRQQRHADRGRADQAGRKSCRFGGAAGAASAVTRLARPSSSAPDRPHRHSAKISIHLRRPRAAADAFIQQCCRIATFPRRLSSNRTQFAVRMQSRRTRVASRSRRRIALSCWCGSPGYPGPGSSCAGCCG